MTEAQNENPGPASDEQTDEQIFKADYLKEAQLIGEAAKVICRISHSVTTDGARQIAWELYRYMLDFAIGDPLATSTTDMPPGLANEHGQATREFHHNPDEAVAAIVKAVPHEAIDHVIRGLQIRQMAATRRKPW